MKYIAISCLASLALMPALSSAQTLAIGKSLFNAQCLACHGTPPRMYDGADKGTNNPAAIQSAISRNKGGMGYLSFLSTQDLRDIATYMGNPMGVSAAATTANERILNWAEWKFQNILLPRSASAQIGQYTARGYSNGFYVGMDASTVFLYSNANGLQPVGALGDFLGMATADGF